MSERDYAEILNETRRNLAQRRGWLRRIHPEDRYGIRPGADDALLRHLDTQDKLLKHGKVFWGALIQANAQLYGFGKGWRPGEILCSNDPHFDSRPQELGKTASLVMELKGEKPGNPELQQIAEELTNELTRAFGSPIPQSLVSIVSEGQRVRRHTIIFERNHLPEGVLAGELMPVLFHPKCDNVMFLPAFAWGEGMLELWKLAPSVKAELEREYVELEAKRKTQPLLDVSERAIDHIREILTEMGEKAFVRISNQGGSRTLGMVPPKSMLDDDFQITIEQITFIVDPPSADEIWGARLDFRERGNEVGFIFE